MAGLPKSRCGPKGSQMVLNSEYNMFLTIWDHLDPFAPFWTFSDKNLFTFSVTFLVAMTTFMHKTCTERTKTFLIHRTIDEYTFFAISRHLYRVAGVQKWPIWDQKWPNMAGLPMSRCGPKGSQMVLNGPKSSQMVPKWSQLVHNVPN